MEAQLGEWAAFGGALALALRVGLAGWIWGLEKPSVGERRGIVFELGRAVALGVLLNLLAALALASLRAWTPTGDWLAWMGVLAAGLVRAKRMGVRLGGEAAKLACAVLAVGLAASAPLLRPPRSEWLAGGWDPGIYQNNAAVVARGGGFQGRLETVYSTMTPAEVDLLARAEGGYREVLPGAPVRIEDGSIPLYFFHLTSLCGAWFLRLGGWGLLFRMPAVLAFLGLFPLLALGELLGMAGWRRWVAPACVLLSPTWWYHQAIPTTEMLYLLLLIGGALFYLRAAERGSALPLAAMGAFFAATVNHLNAAVLIGAGLAVAACAEEEGRVRGRAVRLVLCYAAMGLAIWWNLRFAEVTIMRLEEKDQALQVILPVFFGSAIVAALLAWNPLPTVLCAKTLRAVGWFGALVAAAVAVCALAADVGAAKDALLRLGERVPVLGAALIRFVRVVPFHGSLGVALAGAGLAWLALSRRPGAGRLKSLAAALAVVCALLFIQSGIVPLYPWALRRYVVFWVPLLALAQAFAVVGAVELWRGGRRIWSGLLLALLLPAGVQAARISLAAATVGNYAGLAAALAPVERALAPDDVVVADSPEWGTPLLLAGGRDVVNGRRLWRSPDPEYWREYLDALRRVREKTGRRVLWLTSTGDGLDVYPVELGGAWLEAEFEPFVYRTVNHGARGRSYGVRERQREFRLFEWDGTHALREEAAAEAAP